MSRGTSLVVQWLRLHGPNAGGTGSIPGQGTNIPPACQVAWLKQTNKNKQSKTMSWAMLDGRIKTYYFSPSLFLLIKKLRLRTVFSKNTVRKPRN